MFRVDNYKIEKPIIEILNDLKLRFPNGKLRDVILKGDQILVTCPHHSHGKENHPSCFIYIGDELQYEEGTFHCFTCGCSGSFSKFVAEYLDRSVEFAKQWLINNYGELVSKVILDLPKIELDKEDHTYLDESILNQYKPYHSYLAQRRIPQEICERFKIKFDPARNDVIFPVWDKNNHLKFLTRRSVLNKRFIVDKNASKSDIYLLNFVLNDHYEDVIVCESQFNALTCWTYGWPGIALFGAGTTREQIATLNSTPIRRYILMYDPDDAGREGAKRFKKLIRKDVFVEDIILPPGKDVNDLSKKEFENLLRGYII